MPTQDDKLRERIVRALDRFSTGMLVTLTPEGVQRSRPMLKAGHDDDGTVWFVTGAHSGKVDEVALFHQAAAVFQSPRLYVHLAGEAQVVDDRARIRDMWRESWRMWFPNGPEDDDLVLLRLDPKSADLWDLRGTKRLGLLLDAARSWLTRGSSEQHAVLHHQHTAM